MPRPPEPRGRAAGFTLLEVLVAFLIAALALGVMFDGVLGGMRAAAAASQTEAALSLARSRLAETLVALDSGSVTAVSDQQGDDGNGFHWSVQVRPVGSVAMPRPSDPGTDSPQQTGRAVLYAMTVAVGWSTGGGHREVRLDGARLELRGVTAS
jgi:general secretion pathway protein I